MQLRMAPSQAKHKLFVGNIPKAYNQDEVKRQLEQHVKGASIRVSAISCQV